VRQRRATIARCQGVARATGSETDVTPADDPTPFWGQPSDPTTVEPQWLRVIAFGSASVVAAFGAVGLALADVGYYRMLFVVPLGLIAWLALLAVARPILAMPGSSSKTAHVAAALAVVFVAIVAVSSALNASQHVLINRDGGAYANAGRWIAGHGNLQVPAPSGPFAGQPGLTTGSFGMYPSRNGSLSFQFPHLLPAILADARSVGGDRLMFATPGLLAGAALLALFLLAWRLVRQPLVALSAVVAFAFMIPEVSFSRDTYAEIPMQLLVFTALWILADPGTRFPRFHARPLFVAGLFLGLLQATRIDAIAFLIGIPPLFAIAWLVAERSDRRSVARSTLACVGGLVPGMILGFADVWYRSHQYLHDLRSDVRRLTLGLAVSIIVSFAACVLVPRMRRLRVNGAAVGMIAGVTVTVGGFAAWIVRPRVQHTRSAFDGLVAGLQAAAHVTVDPTRTYYERSMQWMSWYLGPVTLTVAIIGAGLLTYALLRGAMLSALPVLAVLGPASALYLWSASAVPDQVWVTRRFLVTAFPLLVLLAFGVVALLARGSPQRIPRRLSMAVAVVIAVAAVAYPMVSVAPLRRITEQRGDLAVINDACRIVGHRGAVLLLPESTSLVSSWIPQTLRGWCGVPVAIATGSTARSAKSIRSLASAWSRAGKTLWLVAGMPATIVAALPDAQVEQTRIGINRYFLERTLLTRPKHYVVERFALTLAPVSARR